MELSGVRLAVFTDCTDLQRVQPFGMVGAGLLEALPFPPGNYSVEIYADGILVATGVFDVY